MQYSAAAFADGEIAGGTAKAAAAAREVRAFIEVVDCGVTPVLLQYVRHSSLTRHPFEGIYALLEPPEWGTSTARHLIER